MKWRKIGKIFNPRNLHPSMRTHASNPVAISLGGSLIKIFFSARDKNQKSSIGWAVIDLEKPLSGPINVSKAPVLSPGQPGLFDDCGVSTGCVVQVGDELWLYYLGWNLCRTVPWRNSIGLAVSKNRGLSFEKLFQAPILDRNEIDPFSVSYPWVIQRKKNDWLIWYGSNLTWGTGKHLEEMRHIIKIGTSTNGILWSRQGKVAIACKKNEFAISRPCVLYHKGTYRMWFCFRGKDYRIGYAESVNGTSWERLDSKAGLSTSEKGWDQKSVEYPHVFEALGKIWMLYNGNDYGENGFGLAIME